MKDSENTLVRRFNEKR